MIAAFSPAPAEVLKGYPSLLSKQVTSPSPYARLEGMPAVFSFARRSTDLPSREKTPILDAIPFSLLASPVARTHQHTAPTRTNPPNGVSPRHGHRRGNSIVQTQVSRAETGGRGKYVRLGVAWSQRRSYLRSISPDSRFRRGGLTKLVVLFLSIPTTQRLAFMSLGMQEDDVNSTYGREGRRP